MSLSDIVSVKSGRTSLLSFSVRICFVLMEDFTILHMRPLRAVNAFDNVEVKIEYHASRSKNFRSDAPHVSRTRAADYSFMSTALATLSQALWDIRKSGALN